MYVLHLVGSSDIIIEPHGRGVPKAILNDRSPRAGLPEGGRSLSMAEGTPSREVLFLLHPFLYDLPRSNAENLTI